MHIHKKNKLSNNKSLMGWTGDQAREYSSHRMPNWNSFVWGGKFSPSNWLLMDHSLWAVAKSSITGWEFDIFPTWCLAVTGSVYTSCPINRHPLQKSFPNGRETELPICKTWLKINTFYPTNGHPLTGVLPAGGETKPPISIPFVMIFKCNNYHPNTHAM